MRPQKIQQAQQAQLVDLGVLEDHHSGLRRASKVMGQLEGPAAFFRFLSKRTKCLAAFFAETEWERKLPQFS